MLDFHDVMLDFHDFVGFPRFFFNLCWISTILCWISLNPVSINHSETARIAASWFKAQCKKPAKFQTAVSICQFCLVCPGMTLCTVLRPDRNRVIRSQPSNFPSSPVDFYELGRAVSADRVTCSPFSRHLVAPLLRISDRTDYTSGFNQKNLACGAICFISFACGAIFSSKNVFVSDSQFPCRK